MLSMAFERPFNYLYKQLKHLLHLYYEGRLLKHLTKIPHFQKQKNQERLDEEQVIQVFEH